MELIGTKDRPGLDELIGPCRPSSWRMTVDFALIWVQALIGITCYVAFPNTAGLLVGLVLVGTAQHGLAMVAHEAAHVLIAPKNRRLNDFIGSYLFAAPILLSFTLYRDRHMAHHRLACTEHDTKELYQRDLSGWRLPWETFMSLSGIDYLKQIQSVLFSHRASGVSDPMPDKQQAVNWMARDLPGFAVVHVVLLGACSLVDWVLYPLMWLLPVITVCMACSKFRSEVEHHPFRSETNRDAGSPYFKNTEKPLYRTVKATPIERVLLSKINFHYHGEHHLWPGVSYQFLPLIHDRLEERQLFEEMGITNDRTYFSALRNLWLGA